TRKERMKLVYLGNCFHIFDTKQNKYVKLSTKNLYAAIAINDPNLSKREILSKVLIHINSPRLKK
ncbi:MAG TPA: hypothetical protein PLW45_04610, partial [Anaerolineaceae bacterium]|nr:hypothetical protein [Anaerolineaceae bacterium]